MKHQNYVLVDSQKTLSKLIEICKIYNVRFIDQDDYPTYKMFGKRLKGGYWLSAEYTGKPITISEFVSHLESEEQSASILDGKLAIQVNNEREFKLLMEHYQSKGWKSLSGDSPSKVGFIKFPWSYGDKFGHASPEFRKSEGRAVIPFEDFAKEVGIEVPVFVMKSEDGVPLYHGDNYVPVYLHSKEWVFEGNDLRPINKMHSAVVSPGTFKAFSTREAAESWIAEQNKPKEIDIWSGAYRFNISKNQILLSHQDSGTVLNIEFIQELLTAYQSLNHD